MSSPQVQLQQKLDALRVEYTRKLPEKIAEIENIWSELNSSTWDLDKLQVLHRQSHSLAGSGSTFGYQDISTTARELDNELKSLLESTTAPSKNQSEQINRKLSDLKKACQAVTAKTISQNYLAPGKTAAEVKENEKAAVESPTEENIVVLLSDGNAGVAELKQEIDRFNYTVALLSPPEIVDSASLTNTVSQLRAKAVLIDMDVRENDPYWICHSTNAATAVSAPRIFISSDGSIDARLKATRNGAIAFFTKPFATSQLIETLDKFTQQKNKTPYRVLIIDDSSSLALAYATFLEQAEMETRVQSNPLKALDELIDFKPELILMDMYMPECSGPELANVIRQHGAYASVPIVFLSAEADVNKQLDAMSLGGDDFLTKPIQAEHLKFAVRIRAERYRELRRFMERDSLTGLFNHRKIAEHLEIELARAGREKQPLSFAMIDIDHFKSINDTYGHGVGDQVLKSLAHHLQHSLRKTDVIGRYGGEEFCIILPNTPIEAAIGVMDKARERFSQIKQFSEHKTFLVSFSCGIATYPGKTDAASLKTSADEALYLAKEAGRNNVKTA